MFHVRRWIWEGGVVSFCVCGEVGSSEVEDAAVHASFEGLK